MDNLSYLENPPLSGKVSFLGIPLDLGKDSSGTDKGPGVIRKLGIEKAIRDTGLEYTDLGDIPCPSRKNTKVGDFRIKYLKPIKTVLEKTAAAVYAEVKDGQRVVAFGGDNTISIGSISGAAAALKGELGVIWIDAHADLNTDVTSLSGNVHGMPVAALLGLGHPDLTGVFHSKPKIKPENVLYIGLKDLDQAEIELIRKYHIAAVTMLDIEKEGLNPVFEKIGEFKKKVKKAWVCLDVDSMDREVAPGTPMATFGGLSFRESLYIARCIGKTGLTQGIDVTEFAPALDEKNRTGELLIELICAYFGGESSWYSRYMKQEMWKQQSRIKD